MVKTHFLLENLWKSEPSSGTLENFCLNKYKQAIYGYVTIQPSPARVLQEPSGEFPLAWKTSFQELSSFYPTTLHE